MSQSHFNQEFNVIYLRLVQGCNLNCEHCFTLGNKDKYKLAPIEQVHDYLRAIRDNVNPAKAVFYIHGGEPFLAPLEYHKQVNQLIRDTFRGIEFNIIPQTNLMYQINEEFVQFLKEEYSSHIGVSWDHGIRFQTTSSGLNEDLFIQNFNKLAKAEIEIAVAVTVQNKLLQVDPVNFLEKLDGAKSIDFEFLTMFDEKTKNLKVSNEHWAKFFAKIVKYYATHDTSWSLPQVDLFTKSFVEGRVYQCKCNCCEHRTFTMNVDGTVGLCPDLTYVRPISTVSEMKSNWQNFALKALNCYVEQKAQPLQPICNNCDYFEYCGGNCEPTLFNPNENECPMSLEGLKYQFENLNIFMQKLKLAKQNLKELQQGKH